MKRVLFIFISLMICVCSYSQKHMKFQGIEIDGTKKDFVDQLIKKGYRYYGTTDYVEMLSGTFNNMDMRVLHLLQYSRWYQQSKKESRHTEYCRGNPFEEGEYSVCRRGNYLHNA